MTDFFLKLQHYVIEVGPSLAAGFFISGIINEFVPTSIINRYLNKKGIMPIIYTTVAGIILPICCIGSLPVAVGLRKKGVALGPVLAFLVATPATSVSAVLVTWKLMGIIFTLYLSVTVVIMGLVLGIIGNSLSLDAKKIESEDAACPHCMTGKGGHNHPVKSLTSRIRSIFFYSFVEQPKEMGLEILIGLLLAATVASVTPVQHLVQNYLNGGLGYIFSLVFGMIMYICSTASVPMVDAFVTSGMNIGAGLVLLLVGPITSYGTILVIKKEFGAKVLALYITLIASVSLVSGYLYSVLF
ncbi:MAG: permease [Elusimicrobia bacterium]|nr:permease [Elusimicrobiota bacterium]